MPQRKESSRTFCPATARAAQFFQKGIIENFYNNAKKKAYVEALYPVHYDMLVHDLLQDMAALCRFA